MFTKRKTEDFYFEETAFGVSPGEDILHIELPISRNIFFGIGIIAGIVLLVGFSRMIFLNVTKGDFYVVRAMANAEKTVIIPAPRGAIQDRFGKDLVKNTPVFSAFIDMREFMQKKFEDKEQFTGQLQEILSAEDEEMHVEEMISSADIEGAAVVPLMRGISTESAIALRSINDSTIIVQDDYRRLYVGNGAFAHVLGYTGVGDWDKSIVGKAGLEEYYNTMLRGKDGRAIIMRDARGTALTTRLETAPHIGATLETSIDGDLQEYFYERLKKGLAVLGRNAGVGIIVKPKTGEVLSLISLPSFDSNVFTTPRKGRERMELIVDRRKPLFNRAISGVYTPGSTIKPMMALAALHERIIDPVYSVYSPGYLELPNPYNPEHPNKFMDWKPQGWVNVYSALAKSSNVFFYVVGGGFKDKKGLGMQNIENYFHRFGFDEKSGIDLSGEAQGLLIGPQERMRRTGLPWRIGDTYNIAIGQGDLMLVPLRLVNFIGSIGTGGRMQQPLVVRTIRSADGVLIENLHSKEILNYTEMDSAISEVQQGLEATVKADYGTAHTLADLPISVAGKTGSSQILNNAKTNAFFVGYAPSKDPEIAILVLVEDAKEGSLNTIPIVHDVLQWYYENRIKK